MRSVVIEPPSKRGVGGSDSVGAESCIPGRSSTWCAADRRKRRHSLSRGVTHKWLTSKPSPWLSSTNAIGQTTSAGCRVCTSTRLPASPLDSGRQKYGFTMARAEPRRFRYACTATKKPFALLLPPGLNYWHRLRTARTCITRWRSGFVGSDEPVPPCEQGLDPAPFIP